MSSSTLPRQTSYKRNPERPVGNQRHLSYAYSLHLESFLPGRSVGDVDAKLDDLAKQQVVTLYMHPHMAVCRQHWDYVFKNGNQHPLDKLPFAKLRDPADTAVYYERIKAFLRKLKADSRFEITDCPALHAARRPRRAITYIALVARLGEFVLKIDNLRQARGLDIFGNVIAQVALCKGEPVPLHR